jgi:hypothetical protein
MFRSRVAAILAGGVLVVLGTFASAGAASAPPGATAQCRDGSYSYSQHHSGTCSHHGGVAQWLDGTTSGAGRAASAPAKFAVGHTVLLRARARTSRCVLGASPDRRCSPGAYYSGLTTAVICSSSFHTSSVRDVSDSERHEVELEYGLAPRAYGHTLEIDHIVSLELGGSNDIANLYPEKAPGFHVKDELENRLHALVCSGAMTLHAAQVGIASNWQSLYKRVFDVAP